MDRELSIEAMLSKVKVSDSVASVSALPWNGLNYVELPKVGSYNNLYMYIEARLV